MYYAQKPLKLAGITPKQWQYIYFKLEQLAEIEYRYYLEKNNKTKV